MCHPGRLLLAGWAISRHHRWREAKQGGGAGAELGVGARDDSPGPGVGSMKGGKLIPGREHVGRLLGWRLGVDGVGTPGLAAASHLAVADDVASLATVGT